MSKLPAALCMAVALAVASLQTHAEQPNTSQAVSKIAGLGELTLPANSPQLANLKIEAVKEITAPNTSPLNGKIAFDENYTARINPQIDGRVEKINVQIGDNVKKGQALMVLDAPDLGLALADARKAQADLRLKQQSRVRSKMLYDHGVIARKELETSDADLASAEAEAARAGTKLRSLGGNGKVMGENYVVTSPINGVVVDRKVNPGSMVQAAAQDPTFIITDPSRLWATIDLPERDLSKVSKNQKLAIEVDAYPNETFDGYVQSIGEMVDPATRRISVRCVVQGRGKLKPEMYARITPLAASGERVIRIPNSALVTQGLYTYVFVETSPGHLVKRQVKLAEQTMNYSIVGQGLQNGDRVVTIGAMLLNAELTAGK